MVGTGVLVSMHGAEHPVARIAQLFDDIVAAETAHPCDESAALYSPSMFRPALLPQLQGHLRLASIDCHLRTRNRLYCGVNPLPPSWRSAPRAWSSLPSPARGAPWPDRQSAVPLRQDDRISG